ncbi:hypothetical protein [Caldibacillus debilis]|jgi:hypothetical protein|uniref:hypothetical protein n=1 Tax=Caldibacillus debilis TaxID=301148 RepID=UPI00077958C8|nr:hypothetical protein [Caldibacillus debilis]
MDKTTIIHILGHLLVMICIYVENYRWGQMACAQADECTVGTCVPPGFSLLDKPDIMFFPAPLSKLDEGVQKLLSEIEEQECSTESDEKEYVPAKIAEDREGPQRWVAYVIGFEGGFVHISDGVQARVFIGDTNDDLNIGDVVILDVVRIGREVTVEKFERIETVSEDYVIPDEVA